PLPLRFPRRSCGERTRPFAEAPDALGLLNVACIFGCFYPTLRGVTPHTQPEHRAMRLSATALLAVVLAAVLCGCTRAVQVAVRPDANFNSQSRVTIVRSQPDPMDVQGQLEFLLTTRGFNVVSEAVARDVTRLEGEATTAGNRTT